MRPHSLIRSNLQMRAANQAGQGRGSRRQGLPSRTPQLEGVVVAGGSGWWCEEDGDAEWEVRQAARPGSNGTYEYEQTPDGEGNETA